MLVTKEKINAKAAPGEQETQSFDELFQEHWPRVYNLLRGLVGDTAEAEDLALETFLRLYRRPPHDQVGMGGWLYRVATNLGYNALRARRRRERYEQAAGNLAFEHNQAPDPASEAERQERRQRVRAVLAKLKPRSAQLLVLRHSGMSYSELAETFGYAPGSIGTLLARAEAEFEKAYRRVEGD